MCCYLLTHKTTLGNRYYYANLKIEVPRDSYIKLLLFLLDALVFCSGIFH